MKTARKLIISVAILTLLLGVLTSSVIAQTTEIVSDSEDDVIVISEDVFGGEGTGDDTSFEKTADKPNIDITKITYIREDGSSQVTIKLEVNSKGIIEDRNDFENVDPDSTTFVGSLITYAISLETSENFYEIEYTAGNCTLNYEDAVATVNGNELSVSFNLDTDNETFTSLTGTTMQIDVNSLTDMKYYMDIAPDSALFVANPGGPYSANAGESINFTGSYDDPFGLTQAPYSYTWDFDDGTTSSEQNPTHSYQYPGSYEVELTIEDSTGLTTEETTEVTISTGQTSNGNDTNGDGTNNGETDSDGSGLFMFIAVIAILVVVGVVALIFVIRR